MPGFGCAERIGSLRGWTWIAGLAAVALVTACSPPAGNGNANSNGNGNGNANDNGSAAQAVFPADYRQSYTVVRDCRNSIEHGFTVKVWANEIAREAYLNDENPLPLGSILVKEEFEGVDCDNDAELAQWRVMRKAVAGLDDTDGDTWQWQRVLAGSREVVENTKASCIDCHRAEGCIERDYMCTEP